MFWVLWGDWVIDTIYGFLEGWNESETLRSEKLQNKTFRSKNLYLVRDLAVMETVKNTRNSAACKSSISSRATIPASVPNDPNELRETDLKFVS
jgi:hypothetical protein